MRTIAQIVAQYDQLLLSENGYAKKLIDELYGREFDVLNSPTWYRDPQPAPTAPGWYYGATQHIKGVVNTQGIRPYLVAKRGGHRTAKDRDKLVVLAAGLFDRMPLSYFLWFGPVPQIEERQP